MSKKQLSCQNKGCGKYYDEESALDDQEQCHYHTGGPVFHDALKGWSCCTKRVTEFDAFLKIPGCTVGKHSNIPKGTAAAAVVKPTSEATSTAKPVKMASEEKPKGAAADSSTKVPVVESFQTSSSLLANNTGTAADAASSSQPAAPPAKVKIPEAELHDKADASIEIGVKCKRPACGKPYADPVSREEACIHHAGSPVFHEGSKGWSCCPRKVMEFDEFLKIPGCQTGLHRFTSGQDGPVVVECRRDWYQTQEKIIISVFAKKVDKSLTKIQFLESRLLVDVVFEDKSISTFHTDLFQPIVPSSSSFQIFGTKIELSLQKSNGMSWAALEPRNDVTSWTSFGLNNTGGGTVGGKEALIAGDAPLHLLK